MKRSFSSPSNVSDVSIKHAHVAAAIRRQIVNEHWTIGHRLPTRTELCERFGVSNDTINSALIALRREGFVQPRGRLGTFVSQYPPHLSRYGVVFPIDATQHGDARWSSLLTGFQQLACRNDMPPNRQMASYHTVDEHDDSEGSRLLMTDVEHDRLAGLLFVGHAKPVWVERIEGRLPYVELRIDQGRTTSPLVLEIPYQTLLDRCVAYAKQQGCKRVALLTLDSVLNERIDTWPKSLSQAHGVECRPQWILGASAQSPLTARQIVRLLLSASLPNRPDALVVMDDNLLPEAAQGVLASGLSPRQLSLISHANFPFPTPSAVPTKRIGIDLRDALRAAISLINKHGRPSLSRISKSNRSFRRRDSVTTLPILEEHEVPGDELPVFREAGDRSG